MSASRTRSLFTVRRKRLPVEENSPPWLQTASSQLLGFRTGWGNGDPVFSPRHRLLFHREPVGGDQAKSTTLMGRQVWNDTKARSRAHPLRGRKVWQENKRERKKKSPSFFLCVGNKIISYRPRPRFGTPDSFQFLCPCRAQNEYGDEAVSYYAWSRTALLWTKQMRYKSASHDVNSRQWSLLRQEGPSYKLASGVRSRYCSQLSSSSTWPPLLSADATAVHICI